MTPANDTTKRFARSIATAFADERYCTVERYLSNKLRHRALRFMRRMVRWLMGPRP